MKTSKIKNVVSVALVLALSCTKESSVSPVSSDNQAKYESSLSSSTDLFPLSYSNAILHHNTILQMAADRGLFDVPWSAERIESM